MNDCNDVEFSELSWCVDGRYINNNSRIDGIFLICELPYHDETSPLSKLRKIQFIRFLPPFPAFHDTMPMLQAVHVPMPVLQARHGIDLSSIISVFSSF